MNELKKHLIWSCSVLWVQLFLASSVCAHGVVLSNPLLQRYKDEVIPYIIEEDWDRVVDQVNRLLDEVTLSGWQQISPKSFPGLYALAGDVDAKLNTEFTMKLRGIVNVGDGSLLAATLDQIFYYEMREEFVEVEKLLKNAHGYPDKHISDKFKQARDYFSAIFEGQMRQKDDVSNAWVESIDDALDGLASDFDKRIRIEQSFSQFIHGEFLAKIEEFIAIREMNINAITVNGAGS